MGRRAVDESLRERIREVIGDDPNVDEIRMFGGLCFMLNGNMLVCTMKAGDLLVRTGEARLVEALARPGAGPITMGGREMKGYVRVDGAEADDTALRQWIAMATDFVGAIPPKVKAKGKVRKS